MLAGIGGRTIAEAKANLSYQEYLAWCKYRELYGPLHVAARVDHAAATVAHTVSSTVPRRPGVTGPRFDDFLPKYGAATAPITLEEAMRQWQ